MNMTYRDRERLKSWMESITVNSYKKVTRIIEALKRSGRHAHYECIYDDYQGHRHFRVFYWKERVVAE